MIGSVLTAAAAASGADPVGSMKRQAYPSDLNRIVYFQDSSFVLKDKLRKYVMHQITNACLGFPRFTYSSRGQRTDKLIEIYRRKVCRTVLALTCFESLN